MLETDRDALLCDLAETYHIYDLRALPLRTVALLAYGLRDDSRIKMKLSGAIATQNQLLLALLYDRLSILQWFQTEDGHKNINRPESLYLKLAGHEEARKDKSRVFRSSADFSAAFAKLAGGD